MSQSRLGAAFDAVANVATGIGVAFALISLVRSYAGRRVFNWWGARA